MGLRDLGLGFGVLGLRVWSLGSFAVMFSGLSFGVLDLLLYSVDLLRVQGLGFRWLGFSILVVGGPGFNFGIRSFVCVCVNCVGRFRACGVTKL